MCGDVILVTIVFFVFFCCYFMYNNVFCFFSFFLYLSLFVSLSVSLYFLMASFDGLRPLLVTNHCSLRSLANKLRSFFNNRRRRCYCTIRPFCKISPQIEFTNKKKRSYKENSLMRLSSKLRSNKICIRPYEKHFRLSS